MSLTTILSELWRFLKDSKVKILMGALIMSVLAVLGNLFLPNLMGQPMEEVKNGEQLSQLQVDEDAQSSRNYLMQIYAEKPAEFEVFIQLEDGNVFGNSFILDEYFTSPAVIEEIERETGIDYSQTLAHEMNLGLYKTSQYRGSIAGIRDTSSNVITIRVQAAESSEENLILAQAFADRIFGQDIPFMQGLSVTPMREPSIGEYLLAGNLQMVSSPEALGIISPVESSNRSNLLYAIAGFIMGLLLTTVVLFLIQLFKNKINYAFQYSWDFSDHHFIMEKNAESKELSVFLTTPEMTNQLLVHQNSSFIEQLVHDHPELHTTTGLSRMTQNKKNIEEIVLFIESKVTDKEWFNEQYRLAEMYHTQMTIIQVINRS